MTFPSGHEKLPTTKELKIIPILKDKEVDPRSNDGRDRTLMIDTLPKRTIRPTAQHTDGGVYVGEGLPPIPQRVAKRIVKGDFVEMEELLPELWPAAHQESEGMVKKNRRLPIY